MSLNYLIREPKNTTSKTPLLILLHGYGSNAEDLFSFASELPEDLLIISAQAPHNMGFNQYAWYTIHFDANDGKFSDIPEAIAARDLIATFIDELKEKHQFDHDNITLLGFSQGAILSYSIAFNYPEKIKQVIALSGYLNPEINNTDIDLVKAKNIPFYISHGTEDQVLPVALARETVAFLEEENFDVSYHEYAMGHGVSPQNFVDFKKWLIARI